MSGVAMVDHCECHCLIPNNYSPLTLLDEQVQRCLETWKRTRNGFRGEWFMADCA